MPSFRVSLLAAVLGLACGTTDAGGSGSGGPVDGGSVTRALHVRVSGNGTVRAASFNCRSDCQQTLSNGQAVHLEATPDAGWKFDGWQGDCGGTAACDLTMSSDRSAVASFSPVSPGAVRVTVNLVGDGAGRVKSSPAGIDCPGACSMTVAAGTVVTLAAAAESNSSFAGFGGPCSGPSCSFTAASDAVAWANFVANSPPPPVRHTLTVVIDGQGRVTSTPGGLDCPAASCSAQFDSGTPVSLAAAAGPQWSFASWTGACSGKGDCSVKLDSDLQVTAHFNAPPPPPAMAHVIVTVNGRGQVTGSGINCGSGATACDVSVPAGTAISLTATAAGQARFVGWAGPCTGTSSCSFAASGELRVTANFQDVLTTLVANDSTNSTVFALNSTDVFYGRNFSGGGSAIWSVPKAGGTPRQVSSGVAGFMVADDAYVYWSDLNSVYSAPVQGGPASQIFSGSRNGISHLALDSEGALYFSVPDAYQTPGEVHRMQSRQDTVVASSLGVDGTVAVDDAYVYFGASGSGEAVYRVPKHGGTVETLAHCPPGACIFTALKVDAANVYARTAGGAVYRIAKASPALQTIEAGVSGFDFRNGLDAWGSIVYWNENSSSSGMNGIFSARADGTGRQVIETGAGTSWSAPLVDDVAVYYWQSESLMRRLKQD